MIKKFCVICVALLTSALFSACAANSNPATPDEAAAVAETTEQKVVKFETPYADLAVSEKFDEAVKAVVRQENPYIVDYITKADNTKLFAIHFNDKTNNYLGSIKSGDETVLLYAEFFEIKKDSENYQKYTGYQMEVNTIVNNLEKDYSLDTDEKPSDTSSDVYDIKTNVVTLKYPKKWENKVTVKQENDCVKFSADNTPLFDLYFKECNGVQLGTYDGTPIYIVEHKVEKAEHKNMIQDVNVIINHLSEDAKFTIN